MRVLFVTGHFASGVRKVDLHFIAEELALRKFEVSWLTIGLSPISAFKGDDRWRIQKQRNINAWSEAGQGWREFIWVTKVHPFNLRNRWLNDWSAWLFSRYPGWLPGEVLDEARKAAIVIIESGLPPLLVPVLRAAAPNAQFVYNAADRPTTLRVHPLVIEATRRALGEYAVIRAPAQALVEDFGSTLPRLLLPHGIDKKIFDEADRSPYGPGKHAVSVGNMLFSDQVVEVLADAFPKVSFHLFGAGVRLSRQFPNVKTYGEVPFKDLVPYIKFADVGVAAYREAPDVDYLSQSSLKMIQYTYSRLPIVAPRFAAGGRKHVLSFCSANKRTIVEAMRNALKFDRKSIDVNVVRDWSDVTEALLSRLNRVKRK